MNDGTKTQQPARKNSRYSDEQSNCNPFPQLTEEELDDIINYLGLDADDIASDKEDAVFRRQLSPADYGCILDWLWVRGKQGEVMAWLDMAVLPYLYGEPEKEELCFFYEYGIDYKKPYQKHKTAKTRLRDLLKEVFQPNDLADLA